MAERAELERCSQRRWIVDAVRAGLTHEPQPSTDEMLVLGESNYRLITIGHRLKHIEKHLQASELDASMRSTLASLPRLIAKHTEMVSQVLGASQHRWRIE